MVGTFVSFLFFTLLVAFITWLKTKKDAVRTADGYFLAGRSLTAPVIAGSLMLTNLSTEQLVGLNGVSFEEGFVCMAWETLASLALVFLAVFFLPRYLKSGLTTIPQFMEDRYDRGTRVLTDCLFLSGYLLILLPTILYSGAIAVSGIFNLTDLLSLDETTVLWITVWVIGMTGSGYAIFGGLKSVAVSDSLNGIGLLVGGILIPVFGLMAIGDGSLFTGLMTLRERHPEMFSAIGKETQSVPFSTLFTGMMLVNTFYWCTNQAIIQRALGAKNLMEGQKGVLLAAFLKLLGPIILVLPGIIAFHLFGPMDRADHAYPRLVQTVLPSWLTGFFVAVLVGAILSSYNSALNSSATLFSKGIYCLYINQKSSEADQVRVGKIFGSFISFLAMFGAPFISKAPQGLFGYLQEINGCYSIPILTVLLVGIFHKRVPPLAAKVALICGVSLYIFTQFILRVDLHFLHVMAILFLINTMLMLGITVWRPRPREWVLKETNQVEVDSWPFLYPASFLIIFGIIASYLIFSPLSLWWLMVPLGLSLTAMVYFYISGLFPLKEGRFARTGELTDSP